MKRMEIERIARKYAIAVEQVVTWRYAFGARKRRSKRPSRTLSIGDIAVEYGLPRAKLARWRRDGLPSDRGFGGIVLIMERDLLKWIEKDRRKLLRQRLRRYDNVLGE